MTKTAYNPIKGSGNFFSEVVGEIKDDSNSNIPTKPINRKPTDKILRTYLFDISTVQAIDILRWREDFKKSELVNKIVSDYIKEKYPDIAELSGKFNE
jgi:hypothetical protein